MSDEELKDLWFKFLRSPNVDRTGSYTLGSLYVHTLALKNGSRTIAEIHLGGYDSQHLTGFGKSILLSDDEYNMMLEGYKKRNKEDFSYKQILGFL